MTSIFNQYFFGLECFPFSLFEGSGEAAVEKPPPVTEILDSQDWTDAQPRFEPWLPEDTLMDPPDGDLQEFIEEEQGDAAMDGVVEEKAAQPEVSKVAELEASVNDVEPAPMDHEKKVAESLNDEMNVAEPGASMSHEDEADKPPYAIDQPAEKAIGVGAAMEVEKAEEKTDSAMVEEAVEIASDSLEKKVEDDIKSLDLYPEEPEAPPVVTRNEQWKLRPRPKAKGKAKPKAKASGRGRGRGRGKGGGEVVDLETEEAEEEEEVEPQPETPQEAAEKEKGDNGTKEAPKAKAKAKAKAKGKAKAQAKEKTTKPKAQPKRGRKRPAQSVPHEDADAAAEEKPEDKIVWKPVSKEGVAAFEVKWCPCQDHASEAECHEAEVEAQTLKKSRGEEPTVPVVDQPETEEPKEPDQDQPKKGKNDVGIKTFARRVIPKTSPAKQKWMAIRDVFGERLVPALLFLGFSTYAWEDSLWECCLMCLVFG